MTAPPGVPACLHEDPNMFASTVVSVHEKAREFCDRCPVVDWCLAECRDQADKAAAGCGPVGTWGGYLYRENGTVLVMAS